MGTGAITQYIDVAQIVLYAFWIFFAALIYYLRQEDKREGYPLEQADASPHTLVRGFPMPPAPKTFMLPHGGTQSVPKPWAHEPLDPVHARPVAAWPGAPLEPTGNPMLDGVGPGAWAQRTDAPDLTLEGLLKIVPLRVAPDYSVSSRDPDPRGKRVYGGDGAPAGVVRDLWVDRSERLFRYFEVEVQTASGSRQILLPVNFSVVRRNGSIKVKSILASQFSEVPALRNPDQVTFLEEEKIVAYYGAGCLYATPARQEPLL